MEQGKEGTTHSSLDLETPMQKMEATLREMQADPMLLHWQPAIARLITTMRENAQSLWLPSSLANSNHHNDLYLSQIYHDAPAINKAASTRSLQRAGFGDDAPQPLRPLFSRGSSRSPASPSSAPPSSASRGFALHTRLGEVYARRTPGPAAADDAGIEPSEVGVKVAPAGVEGSVAAASASSAGSRAVSFSVPDGAARSPSPSMDLPRERSACEVDARVSSRGGVVPGGERIIMGASAVTVLGGGGGMGAAPAADGDAARFVLGLALNSAQDDALAELDAGLHTWDFGDGAYGIFGMQELFGPDLLFFILEAALRKFDLFEAANIDLQKLYSFASNVQSGYRALPYHNALHACDVTHTMFWQLDQRFEPRRTASADGNERGSPDGASALTREPSRRGNPNAEERTTAVAPRATPPLSETVLGRALPNHAVLAALLGAAVHDIGHDGFNNAHHVAIGSPLALQYNDQSVLENMHAATGLGLLREPRHDVLENLSAAERRKFRALVVEMVLGTDLSKHFEQLSQFQVKLAEGLQLSKGADGADGRDVTMFLANALHAADIGSTAKPSETYYRWMQGVFAEFFAQGDAQRELGLEVTPFMDRTSASIPKAQQGFLKYICQPIFTAMAQPIPAMAESAGKYVEHNIETLRQLEAFGTDTILADDLWTLLPDRVERKARPMSLPRAWGRVGGCACHPAAR